MTWKWTLVLIFTATTLSVINGLGDRRIWKNQQGLVFDWRLKGAEIYGSKLEYPTPMYLSSQLENDKVLVVTGNTEKETQYCQVDKSHLLFID